MILHATHVVDARKGIWSLKKSAPILFINTPKEEMLCRGSPTLSGNGLYTDDIYIYTHMFPHQPLGVQLDQFLGWHLQLEQSTTIDKCCCLPTPMTLASGGESDVPACGPPASFSVHLTSSAVTPARSVHKSRGEMWCVCWCS